jgi:hypothetical protein
MNMNAAKIIEYMQQSSGVKLTEERALELAAGFDTAEAYIEDDKKFWAEQDKLFLPHDPSKPSKLADIRSFGWAP